MVFLSGWFRRYGIYLNYLRFGVCLGLVLRCLFYVAFQIFGVVLFGGYLKILKFL